MNRIRLGMLTPSSNTVVEPITSAILQNLPHVSAHFSRFRVTEISLSSAALSQFDPEPFMSAAALLADAKMDVIAWNGTSAAWRGFDEDEQLCTRFNQRFEVKSTASMLALNYIMRASGVRRFALVTPYIDEVQHKIIHNYIEAGFEVVDERHSGIKVNFDFCMIPAEDICAMVRAASASTPQAIIIVCTNLPSANLVADLEAEIGIPVYDSTSAVVWHALRLANVDTRDITGWGRLFADERLQAL